MEARTLKWLGLGFGAMDTSRNIVGLQVMQLHLHRSGARGAETLRERMSSLNLPNAYTFEEIG